MGVYSKIYGMIGLNLVWNDTTKKRILDGLNITEKELEDKYDGSIHEYFDQKGLDENNHKNQHKNTYRFIYDGMDGEYVRCGLVIFENDSDNLENIDYTEIVDYDKQPIQHMLKILFGLDVDEKEIKTFVFTHYT